jgi:hypothetical protein
MNQLKGERVGGALEGNLNIDKIMRTLLYS